MNALYIIAVLLGVIVLSEWLAHRTFLRHLGTALLTILLAAILANTGVIPSASNATPLYSGIFHYVAPLAIFLLLLQVDLVQIRQAGIPMLIAFGLGSVATVAGVLAGLWLTPLGDHLGNLTPALGGMFAATYTGGSINFNAIALHYEVNEHGALYAGALAVDNIMTMIWMVVTLLIPRIFGRDNLKTDQTQNASSVDLPKTDVERMSVTGLSTLLGLAAVSVWISGIIADWSSANGLPLPSVLIMTTLALILAQFRSIRKIAGARALGLFSVYLFLAVIGAHAELAALNSIGPMAGSLLLFVTALLAVHGMIIVIAGRFFNDWPMMAIASQANIGGAATAIALAETFEREDLLFPAILVGSLGTATGTYIGFAVAGLLT